MKNLLENASEMHFQWTRNDETLTCKDHFIAGAKWQQEQEKNNENSWFNEYQEVENYIIKRIGDKFLEAEPEKYNTASEATIALLENSWQQEQDNEVIQNLKDRLDTIRDINTTIIKAVEKLKEQYDSDVINAFNEGQALSVRGKLIQGKEWFEKFKKK